MANPEWIDKVNQFRTQAGEPYQNFENRRRAAIFNYIPLPTIGEGLGEWFAAPSYEEGVGDDGGFWRRAFKMGLGYPQQGKALKNGGWG